MRLRLLLTAPVTGLRRGDHETLDPMAEVTLLIGRMLEVFWTGARVTVEEFEGELVVVVPGYIAEALALVDDVVAKVGGVEYATALIKDGTRTYVLVDPMTGLGMGNETDLFLEVD